MYIVTQRQADTHTHTHTHTCILNPGYIRYNPAHIKIDTYKKNMLCETHHLQTILSKTTVGRVGKKITHTHTHSNVSAFKKKKKKKKKWVKGMKMKMEWK